MDFYFLINCSTSLYNRPINFFLSLTKNFFADIMLVSTNKQSEVMEVEKRGTKERILEAATTLIADNGYKETTTKDIAAAAGVSDIR